MQVGSKAIWRSCLALGHGIPYKGQHDESDMFLDRTRRVGPSLVSAWLHGFELSGGTPRQGQERRLHVI